MIEVGNEWSAQFIAHIQEAEKLWNHEDWSFEYLIQPFLNTLWLVII
jgi:hypothetical protein